MYRLELLPYSSVHNVIVSFRNFRQEILKYTPNENNNIITKNNYDAAIT